jgi:hypothetical protein
METTPPPATTITDTVTIIITTINLVMLTKGTTIMAITITP